MFRESRQDERVFFVEEVSGTANLVANVFVSSTQHEKTGVMVADRGFQETAENGDRFLVLLNGRRYEGEPGTTDYKISEFERYAMRIETREARARGAVSQIAADAQPAARPVPAQPAASCRGASGCRLPG